MFAKRVSRRFACWQPAGSAENRAMKL
jgi:hypothetical protein